MNAPHSSAKSSGFTLVELSIVMIIIGLLIGGVLKGQELIQNTRIKRTMGDINAFRSATLTFQDSYGGLPGDIRNAGARIPKCVGMPACVAAGGNSNNHIGTPRVSNWSHNDQSGPDTESTQYWVNLAAADMIGGVSARGTQTWGDLYPESPFGGGYQVVHTIEAGQNQTNGHYMILRLQPTGDPHPRDAEAVLTPSILSVIDKKYDDGIPNRGDIVADGASGDCYAASTLVYKKTADKSCLTAFKFY